jgi:hypothetical protein
MRINVVAETYRMFADAIQGQFPQATHYLFRYCYSPECLRGVDLDYVYWCGNYGKKVARMEDEALRLGAKVLPLSDFLPNVKRMYAEITDSSRLNQKDKTNA